MFIHSWFAANWEEKNIRTQNVTQISWMGQGGPGYCFIRNLSHKYPFPPSRQLIYGYVTCLMCVFPRRETRSLLLCNAQSRQILADAFQLPVLCVVMIINPWPRGREMWEKYRNLFCEGGQWYIAHVAPDTRHTQICKHMSHYDPHRDFAKNTPAHNE